LKNAKPGSYIALQAYIQPTPETAAALQKLRMALRDRYRLATTVGYGPRFLHSTGQLHKGDAGRGLFVQLTVEDSQNVPVPERAGDPESKISFSMLKAAQALGDVQALRDQGRQVLRLDLGTDAAKSIATLAEAVG
jgi:hypothetical protein